MKFVGSVHHDFFTYLVIGAMILSVIAVMIIAAIMYKRKLPQMRRKVNIAAGLLALSLSLVFIFYQPNTVELLMPISSGYAISIYTSQPNLTGGIDTEKYEISSAEYGKIIETLGATSLSRQIVDWNESRQATIKYELLVVPHLTEQEPIYLRKMCLYAQGDSQYASYVVAHQNGQDQTYRIKDKAVIEKVIAALESFIDSDR